MASSVSKTVWMLEPTAQSLYSLSYRSSIFLCEQMLEGLNFSSFDRCILKSKGSLVVAAATP